MILYHFTHRGHLPSILEEGRLRTTESNVSIHKEHAGPDVVWLFNTPEVPPTTTNGSLYAEKRIVRIKVDIPKSHVHKWTTWGPARSMSPLWFATFVHSGGGMAAANHWWVATSPIPASRWREITINGKSIPFNEGA